MFERFTEKAIKVIMLAHEESRRISHSFVGTEQILLGLIGEETGIAAKVLKSMGLNLKEARIEVEKIIAVKSMGKNPKDTRIEVEKIIGQSSDLISADIPFTPRAKKILELSLEESRQLEHKWIGTEHLLLGLICKGEGVAPRVLENLGVNLSEIRIQVISTLSEVTCKTDDNTVETKREHKSIYKCPYCSNEEKIISTPYKCQVCDSPKFILIEDIYIQRITYPN